MKKLVCLLTLGITLYGACSKKSSDSPAEAAPPSPTQPVTDPAAVPAATTPVATPATTPVATPTAKATATPITQTTAVPTVTTTIPNPDAPTRATATIYNPNPNGPFPPVIPACALAAPCTVNETELVIVIDTSISMRDKAAMIQQNVNALVAFFRPFPNVRITLVGDSYSNCAEPSVMFGFDPSIRRFAQCVSSFDAIGRLTQAMAALPFSPTARVEAIIISDGDGVGVGYRDLDFNPVYLSKPVIISTIVGVGDALTLCGSRCTYDAIGYQYMQLAMRTGGGIYEICNPNWSPLFINLYNRML